MPKGQPLPNMMDNEIVQMFYHVIKRSDLSKVDWEDVARQIGSESGKQARERLGRMMKAQEKMGPTSHQIKPAEAKAVKPSGAARGGNKRNHIGEEVEVDRTREEGLSMEDSVKGGTKKAKIKPESGEE